MDKPTDETRISSAIATHLPFLRRFARAMSGNQATGDAYAAATLEAVLADRSIFDSALQPKTALFKVFCGIWSSSGAPVGLPEIGGDHREAAVQQRLAKLTPHAREALLLRTLEGFAVDQIALIMDRPIAEVEELIEIGAREIDANLSGRVLIIEDEAIIAMDLEAIVRELGHEVAAIARTETEAVAAVAKKRPDLVLADIQLADGSSGIDAVNRMLKDHPDLPVIFITAYPERLLTGERPEPTFLITKPFKEAQVRAAVDQALFFGSTAKVEI